MAHIHTEPGQIDHTVTGYIVRTDGGEPTRSPIVCWWLCGFVRQIDHIFD